MTYQVAGQRQQKLRDALGWQAALQTYRPMLSYDDLGHLLTAKPSELHNSIAGALALDELQAAIARLREQAAPLKRSAKEATDAGKALKSTELRGDLLVDELRRDAIHLFGAQPQSFLGQRAT